jgi:hypothetical protein
VKEIPLTQGMTAVVDDEDYARVSRYSWRAKRKRDGRTTYAYATIASVSSRTGRVDVALHRLVMDAPADRQIDHIDGDGLNNRRANLRLATHAQNQANRNKQANNRSGFKGVYKTTGSESWQSILRFNRHNYGIKTCKTKEEAARWYDRAARVVHGEFANLNFPDEQWEPTDDEWEYLLERLQPKGREQSS